MASFTFYVKPLKNGNMQINAAVRNGASRQVKYTGYDIKNTKLGGVYKFWDAKVHKVKGGHDRQDEINGLIADWKNRWQQYLKLCKQADAAVDIGAFKDSLACGDMPTVLPTKSQRFTDVASLYLAGISSTHHNRSYKAYKTIKEQVADYENKTGKQVMLKDISEEFYTSFADYLSTEHNNINNSVRRKLTRIVTIMNYAFRKGLVADKRYTILPMIKSSPSKKVSLLPEELAKLQEHEITNPLHGMVRDAFLFACYTGLRHSDVLLLKPGNIVEVAAGKRKISIIDLTQYKGTKQNTVPISTNALDILEKYRPDNPDLPYFRQMHSQAASRILKEIFKAAKLNRGCEVVVRKKQVVERNTVPLHNLISFHMGRNTYITTLLAHGVSTVDVKDNVGHSDIRTTMGYSKQDDFRRYLDTLDIIDKK